MISDAKRLYDIGVRLALVAEAAKESYALTFRMETRKAREEIKGLLSSLSFDRLDGITKAEFDGLLRRIEAGQSGVFDGIEQKMLDDLRAFVKDDAKLQAKVVAFAAKADDDDEYAEVSEEEAEAVAMSLVSEAGEDSASLPALLAGDVSIVASVVVPAAGLSSMEMVRRYKESAVDSVLSEVRKARANGESVAELKERLLGKAGDVAGKGSAMSRIESGGASVLKTILANAHAKVSEAALSRLVKRYVWLSIMDERTTEICSERNGRIYAFGKGPLPPAHYNCRSAVSPVNDSGERIAVPGFNDWVAGQPVEFARYAGKGRLKGSMADKAKSVLS